jgi:hypothetical protein
MTPEQRIKELRTRQKYEDKGFSVNLYAVKGYFDYNVSLSIDTDETRMLPWVDFWKLKTSKNTGNQKFEVTPDCYDGRKVEAIIVLQFVVISGKYNGEDPDELIAKAESIVGKWHAGKQIQKPIGNGGGILA